MRKIESIQFLRFIAASAVVIIHATQAVDRYFAGGGVPQSFLAASKLGISGVDVFFVISGFVMVYTSFSDKREFHASEFLTRRFVRIFPIYWFYCALYLLYNKFVGVGGDVGPPDLWLFSMASLSTKDIIYSFLLIPGHWPLIIEPGWSLQYEVYFYLCFGIFMTLGLSRGLAALTFFFIFSLALGEIFHPQNAGIKLFSNSRLTEFLMGAGIAYFFVSGARLSVKLAFVLQALGLAGILASYEIDSGFPRSIVWGVPSALLLAGLVFNERNGVIFRWIQKCSFLGNSSYSLYLIHLLLIDVFLRISLFVGLSSGGVGFCFLLTVLSVIFAYVFYELFERNLIILSHRVISRYPTEG